MVQKTDTLERDSTSTDFGSTSSSPPSWSELSQKADADTVTKDTLLLASSALVAGFLLPIPGGMITTVFLVTVLGSLAGYGDVTSGALAGGITGAISGFFGSILLSIVSLGLLTVLPSLVIGAIAGIIGGLIGRYLK